MEQSTQTNNSAALSGVLKGVAALGLFAIVLLLAVSCGKKLFPRPEKMVSYQVVSARSVPELRKKLAEYGLDAVRPGRKIVAVSFRRIPKGLGQLPVAEKKEVFFSALLPAALIVREEETRKRNFVMRLVSQIGLPPEQIIFLDASAPWRKVLSPSDLRFMLQLADDYQADSAAELLTKVDGVPVSITLAQAAIESAWGTSRFAVEGNNLFGIWAWDGKGMVPARREAGKTHTVQAFDSVIDAMRAHTMILNRRAAYEKFRRLRRKTGDPLRMADGLINYSERRGLYVRDVKAMIRENDLTRFDAVTLDL